MTSSDATVGASDPRSFLENFGAKHFRKNMEKHSWSRVGDAKFDGYSKDVFQKVMEEDDRAMKWDEPMQQIVGLYDQVIKGTIPLSKQER